MIHRIRKIANRSFALGLAGLFTILLPVSAYAERPEIDCDSLSEADMQQFYALSGDCANAANEKKYEEAMAKCTQAMTLCTTDVYTEYTYGRLFQLTEDYGGACYHFERLMTRPKSVQKDNADIYKQLKKNMGAIESRCSEFGLLEITCTDKDIELAIPGLGTMSNTKCPFYSKVKIGSYPIAASKPGYIAFKDTINVGEGGAIVNIPALKEAESNGFLEVRCPKGPTSFILTDPSGKEETYICPKWASEVPTGTYKVRLSGKDVSENVTIVIAKKSRQEYAIPAPPKSSCSAAPTSNTASHAGGIFALLAALGLGIARRRRAQ